MSRRSRRSSLSGGASDISNTILLKKAKAKAARVRVQFSMQRAQIEKERANIDAELSVLTDKIEAAAAQAEVDVLEEGSKSDITSLVNQQESIPTEQKVREYLESCNTPHSTHTYEQNVVQSDNKQHFTPVQSDNKQYHSTPADQRFGEYIDKFEMPLGAHMYEQSQAQDANNKQYTKIKTEQQDSTIREHRPEYDIQEHYNLTKEFSKLLLKKELTLSRLSFFTDQPESYKAWKTSFRDVVNEIGANPSEETDLLIKWLGPLSRKHAISIRAANAHDPAKYLKRIWDRLDERFGSPQLVYTNIMTKIEKFPRLSSRDSEKLYELSDICDEIEGLKEDKKYAPLLSYYDTSVGITPIVNKLPHHLQEKWITKANAYKTSKDTPYPPFWFFSKFIAEQAKIRNDPEFMFSTTPYSAPPTDNRRFVTRGPVITRKTEIQNNQQTHKANTNSQICPLHKTSYSLDSCRGFKSKPIEERKNFLKDNGICYRCCISTKHIAKHCKESILCGECGSGQHATPLHYFEYKGMNGGENNKRENVDNICTQICGQETYLGKSCAKLVLVKVYDKNNPDNYVKTYAIIDEQSNRSLAKTELFNSLNISSNPIEYTLSTCTGTDVNNGRKVSDLLVESYDESVTLELPTIIECNQIPDIKNEIPTREVASNFPHLQGITQDIPPVDPDTPILLLIGRDLLEAHHVHEQLIGPKDMPYAQKLSLGWVIIGESCLGKIHKPDVVNVFKTSVLGNGRTTLFTPCTNVFDLKVGQTVKDSVNDLNGLNETDRIGTTIFAKTEHDEKIGTSVEDREFMHIMNNDFSKDNEGNWVSPLPFRKGRPRLPNNRSHALKRAQILNESLIKNREKQQHFVSFMKDIIENNHAELAPILQENEECWYLPIFGVYHPKKPNQIRGVFDSSAKFKDLSLNDVLLTGPDLTNSLLGVLLRFRKESIVIMADIQKMFYCFKVTEEHRNFLRFFWYRDNNPDNELTEYRMCVQVFGNSPSPSIATYGLQRVAEISEKEYESDVKTFIERDFYVDDGLTSLPTSAQAIDLMHKTQKALLVGGNIRLHKLASNSPEVVQAFPSDDLAKDLKDLDLSADNIPLQRSLGLSWNLKDDEFTFQVSRVEKKYTRRGILSTINSIYDPIGFLAPVTIQGKILLRELMLETKEWDEPLPLEKAQDWEKWKESLRDVETIKIPRTYTSSSLSKTVRKELHVFSDASEKAIAASAYLLTETADVKVDIGFVLGKAKVAPKDVHTIPRLELCAAVLAVEITDIINEQINIEFDKVSFYTDSKVVLGYINNKTKRFYNYVSNRVEKIRKSTSPQQWSYVNTNLNPADSATRATRVYDMLSSPWLSGPRHLLKMNENVENISFPLVEPEKDKEIRREVHVLGTNVTVMSKLGSHRFEHFTSWTRLVNAIGLLQHKCRSLHTNGKNKPWQEVKSVSNLQQAEQYIIKVVQRELFGDEIINLVNDLPVSKNSSIITLNPVLDKHGILRVGGRLERSTLSDNMKHPIIIPKNHHVAILLVRYYHSKVIHQGRLFTEGAVRAAGFWIVGCKRLISSIIQKCVTCRKSRGKVEFQKMSDLPGDRIQPSAPFTNVGIDIFGPWSVSARRTRGGHSNSKRWGILFTCLTTRAVHIELVEEMTSSAFINALRRFIAIRGNVKVFRSDRGTNFVGACSELRISAINVEDAPIKAFLESNKTVWIFNAPYSSHMGGVWERMIGVTRRILDSMLTNSNSQTLTHDILNTFMAEVCAIINARPLVSVSTDPDVPEILSPSMLLTQKSEDIGTVEFANMDFKSQWKRVQMLADSFWKRWQSEYLHTLQVRRKWTEDRPNLKPGDVVLLRDKSLGVHRNDWPVGVVVHALFSEDDKVRKVEVRVVNNGRQTVYTRPIAELILLITDV